MQQDYQLKFELESPFPSNTSPSYEGDGFEERVINGKKCFSCTTPGCGKIFKFKSEMKRHTAIHSSQRPFVCSFPDCGKTFKRADALSNHFKIHNRGASGTSQLSDTDSVCTTNLGGTKKRGQKTYACTFPSCKEKFSTLTELKQHEKTSSYHQKVEKILSRLNDVPAADPESFNLDEIKLMQDKENMGQIDFTAYTKSANEPDFASFGVNFDEVFNVQGEDKLFCEVPTKACESQDEEVTSAELSEVSTTSNKSGRNLQDTLMSLLKYMIEENCQLRKKLKTTTYSISQNYDDVITVPNQIKYQNENQYQSYTDDSQNESPNQSVEQDQNDFVDSIFKSSNWMGIDENSEKEFYFYRDFNN